MRGTPFIREGWIGGLNSIDSPYTIEDSESRDCLNVVSTTRGSIKKRNGSTLFTQAGSAFPAITVKDTMERAEENPLSNAGHWTALPTMVSTGKIGGSSSWTPPLSAHAYGARWNVEEQASPSVAITLKKITGGVSGGPIVALWACLSASERVGYVVFLTGTHEINLYRYDAGEVPTSLSRIITPTFVNGDSLGISVRSGTVQVWQKHAGTWTSLLSVADATYTTGYTGFQGTGLNMELTTFGYAETANNIPAVELTSLAQVTISGTKTLIAAGGTHLYKINTSGEVTSIGEGFTSGLKWSIIQAPTGTGVSSKQGPVYLTNGTDAPQSWTGTELEEWKGISSSPERTDGEAVNEQTRFSSKTAFFLPSDVGAKISSPANTPIPANSTVLAVLNPTTIELSQAAVATNSSAHFTLTREYYATAPHVPKGKYCIFAHNRVWMTGISSDPSAVWFSELVEIGEGGAQADPTAWPTTNVVRFDSSDGKPITGIGTVGPYVCVFKERKTWVITNLDTGANRRLADNIGCVAHRSIVETIGGTFFLTADQGVYLMTPTAMHEMSYKVRPTILAINRTKQENAAGAYFNNHYYLSFPSGTSTTNNRTLDYDVQLKAWWPHDLAMNQWVVWEPSSTLSLYGITPGTSKGVVAAFVAEVFTDVGAPYAGEKGLSAYWFSSWFPFFEFIYRHRIKTPTINKRVRQVAFNGSGSILPMVARNFANAATQEPGVVNAGSMPAPTLPVNFSQGETIYGNEDETQLFGGENYKGVQMIYGGFSSTQTARLYSLGVGRLWSVGFGNATGEPFEVDQYTMAGQFRKS